MRDDCHIVQIAPRIASPLDSATSTDLMPPLRLIELARNEFESALDLVSRDLPQNGPSRDSAVSALHEVVNGSQMLESALVPATPFPMKRAAVIAIEHAVDAVAYLQHYIDVVSEREAPVAVSSLPPSAQVALQQAQRGIRIAIARLLL
jgi:hypothetical protein